MKGKTREKKPVGNWGAFLRLIRQIDLPWPMIALAFAFEMGYSQALLHLPTTTTALMSGSLDPAALRDAILFYVTYGLVTAADFWVLGVAGNLAVRNARSKVWGGMTRIRADFYDRNAPAELSSAITNDLESAVKSLVSFITGVIPTLYYVVAACLTIGQYDGLLMLSVVALLPVKWVYMVVVSRWLYRAQVGIFQRIGTLTGYLAERVKNLPLIKYYTNEDQELQNGAIAVEDLRRANMHKAKVSSIDSGISAVIGLLQNLVTIVFGVILLQKGRIDITQWVTFFLFAAQINSRFGEVISRWQTLKSVQGMAARTAELMEAPQEQSEGQARATAGQEAVSGGAASVEFRDVSFSYGEKPALKNVSFTVPAGTTTAIVGLCGSGKTTLLNLLERFYDAGEGHIFLNGADAGREDLSALRSRFSYVQQDAGVFSGTVRGILTYGIRREVSDRELEEAARNAGAWEFVQRLPGGLDGQVAADGASLSGGQRQRLVLAREFLRNADILLLDEPTSALDAKTAQAVEETILRLFKGKTILMVTHDMSLLRGMDQIVVLQKGEIKGRGDYRSLLEECPLFREMVQMQKMGVELA